MPDAGHAEDDRSVRPASASGRAQAV